MSCRVATWMAIGLLCAALTACDTAHADDAVVRMRAQLRYDPTIVQIPVGATVTWENDGAQAHTVTQIDEQGQPPAGGFDSGDVIGTGRFSHTFEEEGAFAYRCRYHGDQEMVGVVVVGDP